MYIRSKAHFPIPLLTPCLAVGNSSEELEDTKGVIRIRISKKTHNAMVKAKVQKVKQQSTGHTPKTKERVSPR